MISFDNYLIEFINGNWLTLTMIIGLLKIIAKITPNVTDDEVLTLLGQTFGMVPKPTFPVGFPGKEERGVKIE